MHKYIFNSTTKGTIEHIVGDVNMLDISETLEHDAHHIKKRVVYPSGLIMETDVTSTQIEILTNWVLVKLKDGSIVLAEPIPEIE